MVKWTLSRYWWKITCWDLPGLISSDSHKKTASARSDKLSCLSLVTARFEDDQEKRYNVRVDQGSEKKIKHGNEPAYNHIVLLLVVFWRDVMAVAPASCRRWLRKVPLLKSWWTYRVDCWRYVAHFIACKLILIVAFLNTSYHVEMCALVLKLKTPSHISFYNSVLPMYACFATSSPHCGVCRSSLKLAWGALESFVFPATNLENESVAIFACVIGTPWLSTDKTRTRQWQWATAIPSIYDDVLTFYHLCPGLDPILDRYALLLSIYEFSFLLSFPKSGPVACCGFPLPEELLSKKKNLSAFAADFSHAVSRNSHPAFLENFSKFPNILLLSHYGI